MRRPVPALLAVAALAGAGVAAAPLATAATTTTFRATLKGVNEVPDKGDLNGSGTAVVKVTGTKVCFTLTYKGIKAPMAGHIHRGKAGSSGSVLVGLFADGPKRSGCVTSKSSVLKPILAKPSAFYVNLHNAQFPNGALRGQLVRAGR